MLDLLMTPLGRPPLDTYSPTQVIRSAEPMPTGIWEVEAGYVSHGGIGSAVGGIRGGLFPGLQIDLTLPQSRAELARRSIAVQYAPIPALWALNLGYDAPLANAGMQRLEAGTVLELALPWLTPRLAPRVFYEFPDGPPGSLQMGRWEPRVAFGVESRILRFMTVGADLDHGGATTTATLGARFRPLGNLGMAAFVGSTVPGSGPAPLVHGGVITSFRF